jgi:hypothetical protein
MPGISYQSKVNGVLYSWSNLQINFTGSIAAAANAAVKGVTSINYSTTQEKEAVYGAGIKPVGIGYGNKTYEGSITLQLEELNALAAIAPNGDITEIPPFDIIVSFATDNPSKIRKDVLRECEFKNMGVTVGQNDKMIETDIQLFIADIQFNA